TEQPSEPDITDNAEDNEPAEEETGAEDQEAQEAAGSQAPDEANQDDGPRHISAADYLGRRPNPVYPRRSQRMQEQGRVVVRVLINEEGAVINASVQQTSGHDRLDQSALKAAKQARFKPYSENGAPQQAL